MGYQVLYLVHEPENAINGKNWLADNVEHLL